MCQYSLLLDAKNFSFTLVLFLTTSKCQHKINNFNPKNIFKHKLTFFAFLNMLGIRILLILNTCLCVISENVHPIPKPYIHPQEPHLYEELKKAYEYGYAVKDDYTGADFNVGESSDGKVVSGFYSILLPDGRRQNVKYTVDEYRGYVAEVSFEGKAVYPPPKKSLRPHYKKLVPTQPEILYLSLIHI